MVELVQSKKRGRPATGTNPSIGVRLPAPTLASLDAWRAQQPGVPGRPEAIRRLIEAGLNNPRPGTSSGGTDPAGSDKPARPKPATRAKPAAEPKAKPAPSSKLDQ